MFDKIYSVVINALILCSKVLRSGKLLSSSTNSVHLTEHSILLPQAANDFYPKLIQSRLPQ
jgi:hypothetical protein